MSDKEVWDLLGRGSPAGRALFNVYNGDNAGKSVGRKYSERNRRAHEKKLSTGWTPPASAGSSDVAQQKQAPAKVAVPRVGRGTGATEELGDDRGKTYFHYQLRWGGRRSKAEIIEEMERDWAVPPTMPRPTKVPMDNTEKDRLATMMRWRGKPPEVSPEEVAAELRTRRRPEPKSRLQDLEEMFEQTLKEIDDRRHFLDDMRQRGEGGKYERQINAEIQQRIADLKQLDEIIERERGEGKAK